MNFRHTTPESYDGARHAGRTRSRQVDPTRREYPVPATYFSTGDIVMLERCGHFPIEEPGLTQLREAMRATLSVGGASWVRVRRKSDSTRSRGDVTTDAIYW